MTAPKVIPFGERVNERPTVLKCHPGTERPWSVAWLNPQGRVVVRHRRSHAEALTKANRIAWHQRRARGAKRDCALVGQKGAQW